MPQIKRLSPQETTTLVGLLSPSRSFEDLEHFVYLGTVGRLYD